MTLEERIEHILGQPPQSLRKLSGGCVGEVYLVELPGGDRLVAKVDDSGGGKLHVEAYMLRYPASTVLFRCRWLSMPIPTSC